MTFEFLLTSLIVIASPGTGALVTIAAGLARGPRASLAAALGCTLGVVPHMLTAITGLAAVLHASASAFEAIKYLGVAYLLYMAWGSLQAKGPLEFSGNAKNQSDAQVIWDAILVNLLNPKLSIFFVAFLPQFLTQDQVQPTLQMLQLSAVFMAMSFAVFALYGVFAASVRDRVLRSAAIMAWTRRIFAAAFAGLAVKLAFVER